MPTRSTILPWATLMWSHPKPSSASFSNWPGIQLPGMHRYMNNAGYAETRAAVAAKLSKDSGLEVTAGHVIMTCGAGGALNVVLKTILNPGEEVIILAPFFVEYKFYIDNHGGVPVEVWTNHETFQLDIDAISKAITPKTRAILICSPNNPTGVIYPGRKPAAAGSGPQEDPQGQRPPDLRHLGRTLRPHRL